MRRPRQNDAIDDRQTEWADSTSVGRENETIRDWDSVDQGAEAHMFAEDVELAVMPYSHPEPRIEVSPEDDGAEGLVAAALSRERHGYARLGEAVTGFIRECTQTLMSFGTAEYEIVTTYDKDSKQRRDFRFEWVMPYTIRKLHGKWVQDLGSVIAEDRHRERYLPIEREKVIAFELPAQLSTGALLALKKELSGIGTNLLPEFGFDPRQAPQGYDFATFAAQRVRAMAAVTRAIGWNGRGTLQQHITDYYYLVREIRFRK